MDFDWWVKKKLFDWVEAEFITILYSYKIKNRK